MKEYPCFLKNLREYGNERLWESWDYDKEYLENCEDCAGEENSCEKFHGCSGMEQVIKDIIMQYELDNALENL